MSMLGELYDRMMRGALKSHFLTIKRENAQNVGVRDKNKHLYFT